MPGPWMIALLVVGGGLALWFTSIALLIDDWSRDLSTNHAATSPETHDRDLRPIDTPLAPSAAGAAIVAAAGALKNWSLESTDSEQEATAYHFVRTTGLFRFKDDITVRVGATNAGSRITAESQSRVGRGDLGQNPRNIKELFAAIRARLDVQEVRDATAP